MVESYVFTDPAHHHISKLADGTKLRLEPEWREEERGGKMRMLRNGSSYKATTQAVFDELWARGYRAKPKATGGTKPKWTGADRTPEDPKE